MSEQSSSGGGSSTQQNGTNGGGGVTGGGGAIVEKEKGKLEQWKSSLFVSSSSKGEGKESNGKEKEKEVDPIPQSISRNLSDRIYEKRKLGALEIEELVKGLSLNKEEDRIRSVIQYLVSNFAESPQGNARKGGLIALAASAIGLGNEIHKFIDQLIPPVLKCFGNEDSRVRYYACESLYNIAKVARNHVLLYFNEIFDSLCKLYADPDLNVTNGAKLLDRLVKDIITENNEGLDIERFIGLLRERVYVIHPECRQFLISWIMVLDSVPNIDLLSHLPKFLDGLFKMLKDNTKNIRLEAETCITEFLNNIKQESSQTDWAGFVGILLNHCGTSSGADEFTRGIALHWVDEFIKLGKENMLPYAPPILSAILPGLSDDSQEIREGAVRTNNSLLNLAIGAPTSSKGIEALNISGILDSLSNQFSISSVPTRLAGLHWILVLQTTCPSQLLPHLDVVFPSLLNMIVDPSEEVVRVDLEVLGRISEMHSIYFEKMMEFVVQSLYENENLLEKRSILIVTALSTSLTTQRIYLTLARILLTKEDINFVTIMVQTLNLILLTSKETGDLRSLLKNFIPTLLESDAEKRKDAMSLFTTLYRTWSHNASAALSLCLLAGLYEHAYHLIHTFSTIEITVNLLLDLDKLVKLIESPVFLYMRLQLLRPADFPYLFQTLYGLLMLLPQGTAFECLKNRLNSVSSLGTFHLIPKNEAVVKESSLGIPFEELIDHFTKTQTRQAQRNPIPLKGSRQINS
eukprot:TRINITY_DN2920_c0_g1_i1.p1 TRINITY_DN2920_c0_g1~~TRINITY_DN2920_c0_g1_i1.p1  ORF type:complete len:747 (-),score=254.35 TRINITY_DN2920_c0_g1_i1:4-2244(-)